MHVIGKNLFCTVLNFVCLKATPLIYLSVVEPEPPILERFRNRVGAAKKVTAPHYWFKFQPNLLKIKQW